MNAETQIDAALRRMGNAQPPLGLESRVLARLEDRRRPPLHSLSAFAIAASLAVAVVALAPLAQNLSLHHASVNPGPLLRVVVPAKRAFGAASAVNIPSAPLPLDAAPVNQGRGHARPERAPLPAGSSAPDANGVAAPSETADRPVLDHSAHTAPGRVSAVPLR